LLHGVPWFPTIHCGKKVHGMSLRTRLANLGLEIAYQLGKTIPVGDQVAREWNIRNMPIHNPYDDRIFSTLDSDSPRDIDILFVGRIERSKGVFVLVEALQRIAAQLPTPPRCCFVGDGVDDRLLQEATAGCGPGVRFEHVGRLTPPEVAQRMRNSKILVFPTTPDWIEASPLTPLEALACGCRIIATDSGGTRENIGPDGVLVTSCDANVIADAILRLLTAPPVRDMDAVQRFLAARTLYRVADKYLERFAAALM
jgi:glycosyltransferase involved in cell wall biosynthesis